MDTEKYLEKGEGKEKGEFRNASKSWASCNPEKGGEILLITRHATQLGMHPPVKAGGKKK